MTHRALTAILLAAFILAALFGLSVMFADSMQSAGCPFVHGTVLCSGSALDHFSMWQTVFAAILAALSVILISAPRAFRRRSVRLALRILLPVRAQGPDRPPLFQELLSRGILNPKTF